jgi:hypothetical protein
VPPSAPKTEPLLFNAFAAHGNLLAALSILVRLCNHPRLLLPTASTIKKQQQQRQQRTPNKTPTVATEVPFQNSDDEAPEEAFGYAQLVAQLPAHLQQQLQQQPSAQLIAQHGAKVKPLPSPTESNPPPPPPTPPTHMPTGLCAPVLAPVSSLSRPSRADFLPVTRHARPHRGALFCPGVSTGPPTRCFGRLSWLTPLLLPEHCSCQRDTPAWQRLRA